MIVSFSWPGGVIRGCPFVRSSPEFLLCECPFVLDDVDVSGSGSLPLTAVNRDVEGDSPCVSYEKAAWATCASAVVIVWICLVDIVLWISSTGRMDPRWVCTAANLNVAKNHQGFRPKSVE